MKKILPQDLMMQVEKQGKQRTRVLKDDLSQRMVVYEALSIYQPI